MVDNNDILHGYVSNNQELETPVFEGKSGGEVAKELVKNPVGEAWEMGTGLASAAAMNTPAAQMALGSLALNSWSNEMKEYADQLNKYIQQTGGPGAYTPEELQQLKRIPLYVQRGTDGKLNPVFPEEAYGNIVQGVKDTPRAIGGVARAIAYPLANAGANVFGGGKTGEDLVNDIYTKNYMSTWGPQAQRFIESVVPFSNLAPESQTSILRGNVDPLTAAGRQMWRKPISSGLAFLPAGGAAKAGLKTRLLNAANKPGASNLLKSVSNRLNASDIVENAQNWYTKNKSSLLHDTIKTLDEAVKDISEIDLAKIAEAAETTAKRANLPQHLKPAFLKFKEGVKKLQKLIPDKFIKNPQDMAVAQYISRIKNITYKEAQNLIKKVEGATKTLSPIKTADDLISNVQKIVGRDIKPVFKEMSEKMSKLKTKVNTNNVIQDNIKLINQPKKVLENLSKILDDETILSLKDMTGKEVLDVLEQHFGTKLAASDALRTAGIEGIKNTAKNSTTIFGGKALGGYNRNSNTIYLPKNASEATKLHETFHWALDKIIGTSDELDGLIKQATGVNDLSKLTRAQLESLADAFQSFKTGDIAKYGKVSDAQLNLFKKLESGIQGNIKDITRADIDLISKAKQLAQTEEIFPIPHLMGQANKGEGVATLSQDLQEGRQFAGKYSERVYGTQTYEDLAKALKENPDYPIELLHQNVEANMFDEILNKGTLGGESITPGSAKDAVFLDKGRLSIGDYRGALQNKLTGNEAKKAIANSDRFIAVDKNIVKAIEDQLYTSYNAQQGFWGDLFKARKSAMLGSGRYLAGNLTTGVTNTILNSNVHLVRDVIDSIKTQGQLSKSLGTYRIDRNAPKASNKFLQGLANINFRTTGKVLRFLDRSMQNQFAEIAANARLREKGIPVNKRMDYINQASVREVGRLVSDVQKIALLNSNRSLIPKKFAQLVTPFQPFLQWQDTAMQSSLYMLKNHPFLTNVVGLHGMTQLALDPELAQRYGLQVQPEKEIAHYYFDSKTGKTMKVETEFSPVQTSLKAVYNTGLVLSGQKTPEQLVQAGTGEIGQLLAGKNRYGHPLRNLDYTIRDGNRYTYAEDGTPVKVEGATGGEIINGILKMYLAAPNIMDKTVGPLATMGINTLLPEDKKLNYYQAEPGAFIGQMLPVGEMPGQTYPYHNIVSGDPERKITAEDMLRSLVSGYASEYYPKEDIRPQDIAKIYRSGYKKNIRIQDSINNRR